MAKVYIVTAGDYSDYHICAVFSTEKKAEKYIEALGGSMNVEVLEVDPDLTATGYREGYRAFAVWMQKDGTVDKVDYTFLDSPKDTRIVSFASSGRFMVCCVFARDEKHAVKIVNDKRRQLIAENRWGINDWGGFDG